MRLSIGGSAGHVPMATMMGIYHILQHRLSDILLDSTATRVEINLAIGADDISLSISDDGEESSTDRMDRIRDLARDAGVRLEAFNADDGSTQILLDVSVQRGRAGLDQTGNC